MSPGLAINSRKPPAVNEPLVFQKVYVEQRAFVWRSLRRLGIPRHEVPDRAQEVFMVVHRKLSTFDGTSTVATWLFGICLRVAADWRKRASVRRELPTQDLPDRPIPAPQQAAVEQAQARVLLEKALGELSDDARAAFILYELERWPMAQVASAVGCPLQTAYSRLHAARKHIDGWAVRARRPWDVS